MTIIPVNPQHDGSGVAVIGLGRMGSALARVLALGGENVRGWSRSPEKRAACQGFCRPVTSLSAAVGAAPLIILCLPDYDTSLTCLEEVKDDLPGRAVVQLSTGTPADAERLAEWVSRAGATYLDGAIATFPRRIGDSSTTIYFSGNAELWARHETTLRRLAGRSVYIGGDVTAAATADLAWLSMYYGMAFGLLQGAAFCSAGGVDPGVFFGTVDAFMVELGDAAQEFAGQIAHRNYAGDQATIAVHRAALEHLDISASRSGIDRRAANLWATFLDEATAEGHGEHEIAAVFDVIRGSENQA